MPNLTDTTKKVIKYLLEYQSEHGFSPSLYEIGRATGLKSLRGVRLQLDKLQSAGFISRSSNARRAIKLLIDKDEINDRSEAEFLSIPVVGEVQAGNLTFAEQNIEEYIDVPTLQLHGNKDAFLLRIRGRSMTKAGFNPGDLAIVKPQNYAQNGDIVIAYSPEEDGATIKRFQLVSDFIALVPESDDSRYKPIIGTDFLIQGKVLGKLM